MKIKLDENLPSTLARRLVALGHDADTVVDEHLGGRSDDEVWEASCREGRFWITQDTDFADLRRFAPGTHPGLLLVRLPEEDQWRAGDFVLAWLGSTAPETWAGCLVVGTPSRLRIRRPEGPSSPA